MDSSEPNADDWTIVDKSLSQTSNDNDEIDKDVSLEESKLSGVTGVSESSMVDDTLNRFPDSERVDGTGGGTESDEKGKSGTTGITSVHETVRNYAM